MKQHLTRGEVVLQRKALRLRRFDYSQPGTYFVTMTTHWRACWFGEVVGCEMKLSDIGKIAHDEWQAIATRRVAVALDAFIVMPNHLHGIVRILSNGRGEASLAPTRAIARTSAGSLGAIIGSFKAGVSRRVAALQRGRSIALWQPGYQDHIVRTDGELERIRQYIAANPARWDDDPENPERTAGARQASPPQGHRSRSPRPARTP
jgi:REP element-mobilizing transposase RayT